MKPTVAVIALAIGLAGCGGSSSSPAASPSSTTVAPEKTSTGISRGGPLVHADAAWVTRHGGRVSADGRGWLATRAGWDSAWPWPSSDAVVSCTDTYGGTSYVQLANAKNYWFTVRRPVQGQTYFAGDARSVATSPAAAEAWAKRADSMCGL